MCEEIRKQLEGVKQLRQKSSERHEHHMQQAKLEGENTKKFDVAIKALEALLDAPTATNSKKSPDKATVLEVVTEILTDNAPQPIPMEDLTELTKSKLRGKQYKITGVFRNFASYLAEAPNIEETQAGHFTIVAGTASQVA